MKTASLALLPVLPLLVFSLPAQAGSALVIGGCAVFPDDSIWNTPIDGLPVSASSAAYINSIGATRGLHADFGAGLWDGGPIGTPYVVVDGSQPKVNVTFDYADESDPGPYPIPPNPPIEGGPNSTGDRHVLVLDASRRVLYELWSAYPQADGTWHAGSGAVFHLDSNALRPAGWTSADAAGLPVLPGLVRYDEVASGEIRHAIRFTIQTTRKAYVWPARHYASSNTSLSVPPMGQRFRLKAGFNVSTYPATVQVILRAMQKYGIIVADNGSNWYVSGVPDERWNNDDLAKMGGVKGSDFEAVDAQALMLNVNSAQAIQPPVPPANPDPSDGQTNVAVTWTLSWNGGGSTGEGVVYDVFFGAGSLPVTATATGLTSVTFDPSALQYDTTYCWKIVARSAAGQAAGAAWTFRTSMAGDINADGHVDVTDLLDLAAAFGSVRGQAGYLAAADFNADGSVDVVDLLTQVGNFGK